MSGREAPPRDRPLIIGLAGGIGSGKSAVADALAALGCVVCDSDTDAKAALDRPAVRERLRSWWGGGVIGGDGRVDRKAVAAVVFSDEAERRRLESVVHPIVRARREEAIAAAARAGAPAVVVDAPLLFEVGLYAECDAVIFVDTPRERRLAWVREGRGWDEAELARREAAQWPEAVKRARSTRVVRNDAGLAELRRAAAAAFAEICSGRAEPPG